MNELSQIVPSSMHDTVQEHPPIPDVLDMGPWIAALKQQHKHKKPA